MTGKIVTPLPMSGSDALADKPISWVFGKGDSAIEFQAPCLGFARIRAWDDALREVKFSLITNDSITRTDLETLLTEDPSKMGSVLSHAEVVAQFCNQFNAEMIDFYSDAILVISEPVNPEHARKVVIDWGKANNRPWFGPVLKGTIDNWLRDYFSFEFDPVNCAEMMIAIQQGMLTIKKKVLSPKNNASEKPQKQRQTWSSVLQKSLSRPESSSKKH